MTLIQRVDAQIAGQRLLHHPFYRAWSAGHLSRNALERYAEQYYQWVSAFPTFLSATHTKCADLATRREILENLNDEERGQDNHPELWLRFCDALGLDRQMVRQTAGLPETEQAINAYRGVCLNAPTAAALAALYAYESQQPEVMASKRSGLRERYGVTSGLDYFIVHETMDVEHSAAERRLVERLATDGDRQVLDAVRTGLDATYTLLDGVYDRYVA
jgi:pyrroloquinoline-quinone synthase